MASLFVIGLFILCFFVLFGCCLVVNRLPALTGKTNHQNATITPKTANIIKGDITN